MNLDFASNVVPAIDSIECININYLNGHFEVSLFMEVLGQYETQREANEIKDLFMTVIHTDTSDIDSQSYND